MTKSKETVISELRELFEIDNTQKLQCFENDGHFGISKSKMGRGYVISKLQDYFDGILIEGGYCSINGLTLVYTTFAIKDLPINN